MPHFGLMDENALGPEEGPLQRARLHIRCGRRRLRQGKISLGIITLSDAVVSALQWYVASPERRKKLSIQGHDFLNDDAMIYNILRRSGKLDDSLDYDDFNTLVETALKQEMPDYDYVGLLNSIESVMTQLGVMPFDENSLPPEDPSTV
ncbi:MAG: hypothetical protein JSW20_11270 [Nitrospiraceae bacterium]|nr:MAG: hypothetical protein JSW20_11270 [Nitrospiraceae bacterium]